MLKYRKKRYAKNRHLPRMTRLRAAGMAYISLWIDGRVWETAKQRAQHLKMPKQTVLRAVILVGMRYVTTSDMIRAEREWKGIIGNRTPQDVLREYHRKKREAVQAEKEKAS